MDEPDWDPSQTLADELQLRSLALALVRNSHDADDVIQEALLAGYQRGPEGGGGAPLPWLNRVVRNLAARLHRDRGRRQRREARASRPSEDPRPTPEATLVRLEVHRSLIRAVQSLGQPYRDTILLHFFEGLTVSEVADRRGVPERTVRTHLSRGVEQLRRHLRGDEWSALCGVYAAPAFEALAGPSASSSKSATASSSLKTVMGGGAVMTTKVACGLGLVVAIWAVAHSWGEGDAAPESRGPGRVSRESLAATDPEEPSLWVEVERLNEENARLRADLLAMGSSGELEPESPVETPATVLPGSALTIAFGSLADSPDFRTAAWEELAVAALAVNDIWTEFESERRRDGEASLSPSDERRLLEINETLVRFASDVSGKTPSHAPTNGEFTHPLTVANLIAAGLNAEDLPLAEDQLLEVTRLGDLYERRIATRSARYDETSLLLEKIIDELELKHEFVQGIKQVLTPAQRGALFHPEVENLLRRDILSPLIATMMSVSPLVAEDLESLEVAYSAMVGDALDLSPAQRADLAPALDRYRDRVRQDFESDHDPTGTPHYDWVMSSARAHLEVLVSALLLPGLSDDARSHIQNTFRWPVPRKK